MLVFVLLIGTLLSSVAFAADTKDYVIDKDIKISTKAHIQSFGDREFETDDKGVLEFGTTGKAKRLEEFALKLEGAPKDMAIEYRVHGQSYGDMPAEADKWIRGDKEIGSRGKAKRIEGIQIRLVNTETGKKYEGYSVEYQVHMQSFGWGVNKTDKGDVWAKDGEFAGTKGLSKRLEAVRVRIKKEDELKVKSVSAINATGVNVKIEKLTEDLEGQTIEVIDNNGNVVEVKPLNLVIGETEGNFKFKTPLTTDPTGVWTVAGIKFDCDVAAQLKAINKADNTELELWNALKTAGIENLEVANSNAYYEAEKPENGFKTLAEVQEFVDKVNAKQLTGAEQTKKVKELVKLLSVDTPSQVQVLAALQDSWVRINPDFIGKYITDLKTTNKITDATTFKEVQAQLDAVNVTEVTSLVTAAEGSAKRADYNKAVAAMKFVKEDDAEKKETTKADLQKKLDTLNLVLNVKEASTAAQFANAYDALVAHVDNKAIIGTETFYTGLRKEYMEATKALAADKTEIVKDAVGIGKAIADVNTVKRAELYNDVANISAEEGKETSTADVLKRLQALAAYVDAKQFDIKTVETTEARLEAYRTELAKLTAVTINDSLTADAVKTAVGNVQKAITDANAAQVTAPLTAITELGNESKPAKTAENLLKALKDDELALGNVVDANAETYLADFDAIKTAATVSEGKPADAIKALKEVIGDLNQVANINNATTAEEVHTALLALSKNEAYINVPSADRVWVAEKVLEARNKVEDTKKFENLQAVRSALGTAAEAHTNALKGVNDLTTASTITDAISALSDVDADFAELSAAEQATIAEKFLLGLEFNDTGAIKTTFRTLAAVKTAAGL